MLEEVAIRGELRQLDTSLRLDPRQGIQTRGEAWHGMDQAADSLGVILHADAWRCEGRLMSRASVKALGSKVALLFTQAKPRQASTLVSTVINSTNRSYVSQSQYD